MSLSKSTNNFLPLLPGNSFSDPFKSSFEKNQLFHMKHSIGLEKPIYSKFDSSINPSKFASVTSVSILNNEMVKLKTLNNNNNSKLNESYPRMLPQWIKYDKNVLKFDAYFNEHIVESNVENYRIRKCIIYYYLEDDTFQVVELKTENSGIPQGTIVERQKIKDNQLKRFLTYYDINLGKDIHIFGKNLRVCKCNESTKKFYENSNLKLNAEEEIPEYKDRSLEILKKIDLTKTKESIAEFKEYTELMLGGGHPNKGLKHFLENDRKVLSFNISWYDELYDKEEKHYIMNYYLAERMVYLQFIIINRLK